MRRNKAGPSLDALIAQAHDESERGDLAAAEATYRKALALAPDHLGVCTLLGLLLVDRDDPDGASDLLERVRDRAPDFPPVHLALGTAYAAAGHDALAVTAMETAIKLDTSSTVPLERLAKHHIRSGRSREAIGSPVASCAAIPHTPRRRSCSRPHRRPRGRARRCALARADRGVVRYLRHELRAAPHREARVQRGREGAFVALIAPSPGLSVLDLGCGTGLAGLELRPFAQHLVGSDLSPRMIVRAKQRGIYDELHAEDLLATLARARDADLVVAADVFIYVGALEPTFAACARALRPGGLLAFSVEHSPHDDFVLQATLRYAHADAYLRRLAAAHGFSVERTAPSVLRIDSGLPVNGQLFVLRRAA